MKTKLTTAPGINSDLIDKAFLFCENKEKALFMSKLIRESGLGEKSTLGAILIDLKPQIIKQHFGNEIAQLVQNTQKIEKIRIPENIKKTYDNLICIMLINHAHDLRSIFLLLIHKIYLLKFEEERFSKREIKQILCFMPPLASRLNLWKLKVELEDLCFKKLLPEEYFAIEKKMINFKNRRKSYMHTCLKQLKDEFKKHHLNIKTNGRIKHNYSIYKKINLKKVKFEEIYDLIALRIIVKDLDQCYQALGIVHTLWKPILEKIKDYIAVPKPNNYKSLHTTVIGPDNQFIEIQIRTEEMDYEASLGIAAHWQYDQKKRSTIAQEQQAIWLNSVFDLKQKNNPAQFTRTRENSYPKMFFVMTTTGEVPELEEGANLTDLACLINKKTAQHLEKAYINRIPKPLTTKLKNGDLVHFEFNYNSKKWD